MTEGLKLSENELRALEEFAAVVRKRWSLARIKLFGSKAAGTADAESDLDLLVLLPCPVSDKIRKEIVHQVFDINLRYESNISVLIVSEEEWLHSAISLLPIHHHIETEGIAL